MMVDATIEHHTQVHNALNVTLTLADYDPESWFCGIPHPVKGKLRYDGSIGLGVFYKDAIAIWGKKAILALTS